MKRVRAADLVSATLVALFAGDAASAASYLPAPQPEIGLASMALLVGGYIYFRNRLDRR